MSYILNGTTIARPTRINLEPVEVSSQNITINGTHKQDITARKTRYVLVFNNLTKAESDVIVNIYNLKSIVTFQSTEANLPISSRDVLVDLTARQYGVPGTDYLNSFNLILTEVDA